MYIVLDTETESVIGPFESFEDATYYIDQSQQDTLCEMYIEPLHDPQTWYLDNVERCPVPATA